jgi:uncharacterized membrane protein
MASLYATTVLGTSVYEILWLLLLYSVIGVLVEGVFCLVLTRRLELRLGLLYLPLRPTYGVGGLACSLLLAQYTSAPVLVFLFGFLICTVVEYVASLVTEKAFGTVSWDYSDKVLHLQGRVCLQYSLAWGLLALLAVYGLDPLLRGWVSRLDRSLGESLLSLLVILTLLSVVLTLLALARVRDRVDRLRGRLRGEPVTAPETARDRLVDRLAPDPVLINSFPQMELMAELRELTRDPLLRA